MSKDKYVGATLPTFDEALVLVADREEWAKKAVEQDKLGSAREFELTALLLRYYISKEA